MPPAAALPSPLIIAHRGASFDAPENTLAAFGLAWEQGADGIEGDFRLTGDGHVVCLHDATTVRTAGRELICAESTLAELRRLDVGAWKGESCRGQLIPTLAEVLAIMPPNKRMHLEIKCGAEILPGLERTLESAGLPAAQAALMSFDEQVVAAAKQRLPELPAYWLVAFEDDQTTGTLPPSAAAVIETAFRLHADGVGCQHHPVLDEAFAAALRQAGVPVHVWTVNDPPAARRYAALGAASITTDRPGWLRQQLRQLSVAGSA